MEEEEERYRVGRSASVCTFHVLYCASDGDVKCTCVISIVCLSHCGFHSMSGVASKVAAPPCQNHPILSDENEMPNVEYS